MFKIQLLSLKNGTNLKSLYSEIISCESLFVLRKTVIFCSLTPIGITKIPPIDNCSIRGKGNSGAPAVTIILSKASCLVHIT